MGLWTAYLLGAGSMVLALWGATIVARAWIESKEG